MFWQTGNANGWEQKIVTIHSLYFFLHLAVAYANCHCMKILLLQRFFTCKIQIHMFDYILFYFSNSRAQNPSCWRTRYLR